MTPTKAEREGWLPAKKKEITDIVKRAQPVKEDIINLDQLNVKSLVQSLINKYNQDNDVGVIRSWFRTFRIDSQTMYVEEITKYVRRMRDQSKDLVEFKANLMSQEQVLKALIISKIEEAQRDVEEIRADRERIKMSLKEMEYRVDREKYITEQEKERTNLMRIRSELANKIKEGIKVEALDMKQVMVIIEMLKEATQATDIIAAEARWKLLEAEARKIDAEAKGIEQESERKRFIKEEHRQKMEKMGIKIE